MGIADDAYLLVGICTVIIMSALMLLTKLEAVIDKINQSHTYKIVSIYRDDLLKQYEHMFKDCNLRYKRLKRTKNGEYLVGTWIVHEFIC